MPKTKSKTTAKTAKAQATALAGMAKVLAHVLSDTYVLAVKTHGYHWNVTGPHFSPLHTLFGAQYQELLDAADVIAERIRALGLMPDGSMDAFLQNTSIKEAAPKPILAQDMIADLIDSHQTLRLRLLQAEDLADDIDDVVTQDLMVGRMAAHDKTIWMLRSSLA